MKERRVLYFTSSKKPTDGWSVVGWNISKRLKCNLTIYSSEERKKILFGKERLKSESYGRLRWLAVLYDVLNVLLTNRMRPDVIHCNVEHYAPLAFVLSKIYKVPYTIAAHGTYGVLLPFKYLTYRLSFTKASRVITVSNYTKKRMKEIGLEANYEVVKNGVDKSLFIKSENANKEDLIVFVGNLKKRKGLAFLIKSLNLLSSEEKKRLKIFVLGSVVLNSIEYQQLQEYISSNNLNVSFKGKVSLEKLIESYQRSKLNILPSKNEGFHFEGFGLVHLEANACGTLTVGSKNSGNEDAILPGKGFLIDYGDEEKLASIIKDVMKLKHYPDITLGEEWDWSSVAEKYMKIFEMVTQKK